MRPETQARAQLYGVKSMLQFFINKVSVPASFFNDCFFLRYFYIQGCILAQLELSEVCLPTNEIFWVKLRIEESNCEINYMLAFIKHN